MLTITRHDEPADTMTIAFEPPVAFKGGEIVEIALKEPSARQVREAEREFGSDAPYSSHVAYELKLIGLVAGLGKPALEALPIGAVNHAAAFLQEFIEAGGAEGDTEDEAAPEPTTLAIEPPLSFAGVSYAELDLREPLASEIRNARQLMRSSGSLFEARRAQMALVTAVSGLPAPVVDGLRIRTLNEAARVLGRFTTAGRPTGKR